MSKRWLPLWSIPAIIILAVGTVWLRLAIVQTTYDINQADKTLREVLKQKEQTEFRLTALRSPRRLEILAKTKFNLAPPQADQIIYMPDTPSGSQNKDGSRVQ